MAQIIDYTKEVSSWSYLQFSQAASRAKKSAMPNEGSDPLVALAANAADDLDEVAFVDGISKNLQLGRFLLLIVGDAIREDVEHMVDFLQQTPQLGFTLGLVKMGLYRIDPDKDEPLFVQPRIMPRTQEVTRAIVEIKGSIRPSDVIITTPSDKPGKDRPRRKLTEEAFLEQLAANTTPEVVELARWALENAADHNLDIDWGDAGPLLKYSHDDLEQQITFAQLRKDGRLGPGKANLFNMSNKYDLPLDIARDFLDELSALIPNSSRRSFTGKSGGHTEAVVCGPKKTDWPPLASLETQRRAWFAAIDKAVSRIEDFLDQT